MAEVKFTNAELHQDRIKNQDFKTGGSVVLRSALAPSTVEASSSHINCERFANIGVYVTLVKASLTNISFFPQVSDDGTTWYHVAARVAPSSQNCAMEILKYTMTASQFGATDYLAFDVPTPSARFFRVNYIATGTMASSTVTIEAMGGSKGTNVPY